MSDDESYRRMQCPHCKFDGEHVRTRCLEADGREHMGWSCINCGAFQLEPLPDAAKSEEWAQHKARL